MHEQDVRPTGVSVSEAARILRVSPGTIRRRISEGTIHAERVIRPQGTAWRVHLPDDAPATRSVLPTGTSNDASHSESVHAPVTYAPHAQDAPSTTGLVESIARLIAELAEVRVISDRRAERVAELERENGRLSAEVAALSTAHAALAAPQQPVEVPTASQFVTPTMGPLYGRLRVQMPWLLAVLAIVAAGVMLAWSP